MPIDCVVSDHLALWKARASKRWLTTMVSIAENITDLRTQASEPGTNKNILRLVCEMIEELLMQVTSVLKPSDAATKVVN